MSDNNSAIGQVDERNNLTVFKDGKKFAWLSGILSTDTRKTLFELIGQDEDDELELCTSSIKYV